MTRFGPPRMSDEEIAPGILRMDGEEIDLLDEENALLELEDIVDRVRTMAAVSYERRCGSSSTSGLRVAMPRRRSYWRH